MKENYTKALAAVLVHEGGFVNHPKDPGGATNKGVTQHVYEEWRMSKKLPPRTVKLIEQSEVEAIYRNLYWDKIKGDSLPSGVDYAVFDMAVNSGVSRASRFLQVALGNTAADGVIGPKTLAAVKKADPEMLIAAFCDHRMDFLKGLGTFKTFGKGWTRRVEDVRCKAKAMCV